MQSTIKKRWWDTIKEFFKGNKEIAGITEKQKIDIIELIYFFDKIGRLNHARLIDSYNILGPMRHWVIEVWELIEKNVKNIRDEKKDKVNNYGFENLYKEAKKKPHEYFLPG